MALDDIYVRTLTKNRVMIRDNMTDVAGVLDHLMSEEIIRNEQYESIMAERTPTERKRRMMDILVKCSPKEKVFNVFCEALGAEGFKEAQNSLRNDFEKHKKETNPIPTASGREVTRPAQVSSAADDYISDDVRNRVVGEREVALVSKHVGELDFLGLAMGFTRGRIDQFKMYAPYNPSLQVLKMLFEWRSREGQKATVGEFVNKLREGGVDESVMREVFGKRS